VRGVHSQPGSADPGMPSTVVMDTGAPSALSACRSNMHSSASRPVNSSMSIGN
jgi:hypothetical protein